MGAGRLTFGAMVNTVSAAGASMPLLGNPKTTCCSQFQIVWIANTPYSSPLSTLNL